MLRTTPFSAPVRNAAAVFGMDSRVRGNDGPGTNRLEIAKPSRYRTIYPTCFLPILLSKLSVNRGEANKEEGRVTRGGGAEVPRFTSLVRSVSLASHPGDRGAGPLGFCLPRRVLPVLILAFSFLYQPRARAQVLTSQYDNARTGANLRETILTAQNVNTNQFGKVFKYRVDGDIYAQPLYIPGLEIPGKGNHNVVFVATEHDSVYAFDADGHPTTPLWRAGVANPRADATTVPVSSVGCPFIRPEVGITSTPVIDFSSGTLYVLARTKESAGFFSSRFVQRLHALAITTGVEKFGGPVVIQASARGRGDGSSGGKVDFDPLRENPRSALLLANGKVYLTWASSCDIGPYHGWVMAYDARTLKQLGTFNATPDADDGGIWAGDAGPAADDEGNVYAATGNGRFDASSGGRDYGDTALKLGLRGSGFEVLDYFTPFNQQELNSDDNDLGSGGPVLFPGQTGSHPHLLAIAGKGSVIYIIDRDKMGHYHAGDDSHAIQTIQLAGSAFGAPAYWNHHLYFVASDDVLKDFAVEREGLKLVRAGTRAFIDPGATPTVSSNGPRHGIVWVLTSRHWNEPDRRPAVIYAYDAANVARELYNSEQNGGRDRAGIGLRFTVPMVANGRVYIGAKGELDVYGLLPSAK